ncbi:MAG TPA: phosphotransferase [Methanotrichaceae archaeon]|nr:phosphotransferase [Methanotrichaceae archaeon]
MPREKYVAKLRPGDAFRDWLVDAVGEEIRNDRCKVRVFKLRKASHNVCRYEFDGQGYSVVAKFYAEPTGWMRHYDPEEAMIQEYDTLKAVERIIDTARPIATEQKFSCALVTEYVKGRPLYDYMKNEECLYDRLTSVASTLRRLHDETRTAYRKEEEFARFHKILDQLKLGRSLREKYNEMLGGWWYSTRIDRSYGCMIHNDCNPVNYLFNRDKIYAIDFESAWNHANCVHDLGVVAAELKYHFGWVKGDDQKAEPYIGHFLWRYSRGQDEFERIAEALPFFMSMGLLRMARLRLGSNRRSYLIKESRACLKAVA